jgi:K+-transporting ATPase ATPase A chain
VTAQGWIQFALYVAVLVALIRGFVRRQANEIGNFWVDLTRSTLYILLPLSLVLAIVLVSQGVVQSFAPYRVVSLIEPIAIETPAKKRRR